jgi:hypothetical protein
MDLYNNYTETKVLRAYLECSLWTSTDDVDEYLDTNFCIEDIHEESMTMAMADVKKFLEMINIDELDLEDSAVGHDFWLTRNGHGAGFWDRNYDKKTETILMEAVEQFPEVWLYFGDDKKLHFS